MNGTQFLPERSRGRKTLAFAALAVTLFAGGVNQQAWGQQGYQKPPKAVLDVLNAPVTPRASVGRTRDVVLLYSPELYPPIADVARPFLRLAGVRIDAATNGPHNPPRYDHLALKQVADGAEKEIALPVGFIVSQPFWSPDGRRIAFTHATNSAIELWVADAGTGKARAIAGLRLNAALSTPSPFNASAPCEWMPDSRNLICRTIPAGRGAPPKEPPVPAGPRIQESFGKAAPVPTFEDLLENEHESELFDYYATARLALVDTESGKITLLGQPAIFGAVDPAPDGQNILVTRIHRPYSYIVPYFDFPREVEVWDLTGRPVHKLASLPLEETVPIGGVPTGPRNVHWRPNEPATLVWVEALDDGNPKKKVPQRDKVMLLKAPFKDQPAELARTEHRFAGLAWGEQRDFAILRDFDRDTLRSRAWFFDPANPAEMRLVWDMSSQDRYHNPGTPVQWPLPNGHSAVLQQSSFIFLTGAGASPEGDHPFLDRLDIRTLEVQRIFQSDSRSYEEVVAMLSTGGRKLLTRRETPSDAPNYFLRDSSRFNGNFAEPGSLDQLAAFTKFSDPAPQLRGIKEQLVSYKRADGLGLSMRVYLPTDYKPGERRPAVVWAPAGVHRSERGQPGERFAEPLHDDRGAFATVLPLGWLRGAGRCCHAGRRQPGNRQQHVHRANHFRCQGSH